MLTKQSPARVAVKNAELGEVEAVFGTLNVVDRDGDVILPGAIPDGAAVAVSAYGHKSWTGDLPTGAGTIHEVGDELVARVRFFLDTDQGRNTFGVVKGLAEHGLGEWSWSLQQVESERATWEGTKANVIRKVGQVAEVSPVLLGAGIGTRTLAVKGAAKQLHTNVVRRLRDLARDRWPDMFVYVDDVDMDEMFAIFAIYDSDREQLLRVGFERAGDDDFVLVDDEPVEVRRDVVYAPKGQKFSEHVASVVAAADELAARAEEVMALRAAKGKGLSDEAAEGLAQLAAHLERVKTLTSLPNPSSQIDPHAEWLRFVALSRGVLTS